MSDTSSDPVDHSRTTRKHAGETMKNGFNAPGLLIVAAAVVAMFMALAAFATGNPTAGVAATAVSAAAFLAGGGWLFTAHRRVRKQELRWLADHPRADLQPPTS